LSAARRRAAALAALALAVAGTGLAGDPALAAAPAAAPAPRDPPSWREDLGDPVLAGLLRQADAHAPDVRAARARLDRAEADLEAARAPRRLQAEVGAAAAAGGRRLSGGHSGATPELSVTYEPDIFGRLSHAARAAVRERDAARADLEAGRLAAGAETVRSYLALRAAEAAQGSSARRRALAARALDLVRTRAREGAAAADLLAERRANLAEAEAAQRTADRAVETREAELAASLGAAEPPRLPPAGPAAPLAAAPAAFDADAVDLRPDVRAALARLAAADEHRAEAVAAGRPHFSLTAALGAPDAAVALLLDSRALAWAVAGAVSQSLLDGGANRARVHAAQADADGAEAAYRKAVLQGWSQMVAALNARRAADDALAQAQAAADAAQAALTRGETRHAAGAADGLEIVALQDRLERAAAGLEAARGAARLAEVDLALARGGA
jgi:multidrug efflux system outer membrane protein